MSILIDELNKLSKKTYSSMLLFIAIIILVIIFSLFYLGALKLSEVGIGAVQGEEMVDISINHHTISNINL